VSIGQIHGGDDDLLQIMYDGKKRDVGYAWPVDGEGKWQSDLLIANYSPGSRWFTYRIEAGKGTVRIFIDEGQGFEEKVVKRNVSEAGCYFKAGAYTQSSVIKQPGTARPDDYGEALFTSIVTETERG